MQKIPSLFQRNYETDRLVRNEVVPGSEWVLAGEGTATEKIDGTACMVRDGKLWKRYDAKKGKTPPPGWEACQPEPDPVSGHHPGWLPVGDGPEDKWHREAFSACAGFGYGPAEDGTYELVGPKVQGNPYRLESHSLVGHGCRVLLDVPRDYDGIRDWLAEHWVEGIVWWRDLADVDCDKAKVKRRDFGLPWPVKKAPDAT